MRFQLKNVGFYSLPSDSSFHLQGSVNASFFFTILRA